MDMRLDYFNNNDEQTLFLIFLMYIHLHVCFVIIDMPLHLAYTVLDLSAW